MKHIVKKIFKIFIVYQILQFLNYLYLLVKYGNNAFNINKTQEKLVVIGNGPSLNKDINSLSTHHDCDYMCVNNFCLSDHYKLLKPKYYVFMDSYFFKNEVHKRWIESREKVFNKINSDTDWDMKIFLPYNANLEILKEIIKNEKIELIKIINQSSFNNNFNKLLKFCYDINFYCPPQVNVLITSIFIGIKLKYKSIFLFGADLSFHSDIEVDQETNLLYIKHKHFNASDKNELFTKNPINKEVWRMSEFLNLTSKTFCGHELNNAYSKSVNIKIFNCSSFSLIDAYQRKN